MFESAFKEKESEVVIPGQACGRGGNHSWDGPKVVILGTKRDTCSKCGGSRPAK